METKIYEFGAFRLHCSEKCLYQDGRPVNLTPKAVEILILLVVLARVQWFNVLARTSAFQYRDQHVDVRQLGGKLGVAWILEGSIRRQGDTVRVTAQLIRAADAMHVWSETFERQLADLYQL